MSHLSDELEAEEVGEDFRDVVDDRSDAEERGRTADVLRRVHRAINYLRVYDVMNIAVALKIVCKLMSMYL